MVITTVFQTAVLKPKVQDFSHCSVFEIGYDHIWMRQ